MPRRRVLLVLLAVVGTTLAGVAPAARGGTTLFVDDDLGLCDDTDGVPFYCTIQAAVDDAADGVTIQIAAGVYTSSASRVVNVPSGLDLVFHGAGMGVTIVDGQDARGGFNVDSATVTIEDLTVRNGSGAFSGAGITISDAGNSALNDVKIMDSASSSSGGAIYISPFGGATVTLTGVEVTGNTALVGGGLDVSGNGTVAIISSSFADNTTTSDGGAIYVDSTGIALEITRTSFTDNESGNNGGAIFFSGQGSSTLSVTMSTFHSNDTGPSAGAGGGAIHAAGAASLEITHSTFTENTSALHGGAVLDVTGLTDAVIENSTFFDNSAAFMGGAILSSGVVNNVTVTGNQADGGGGIQGNGATLTIANSIVYGNTGTTEGPDCNGSIVSGGYNLFGTVSDCSLSGDTGSNIVGQDPQLEALDDNGGPTETMAIPASSSPAYNAANPAAPGSGSPACAVDDQREAPRGDARCDIGAYEAPSVIRYAGANRYATAMVISQNEHPIGAPHAFVATGLNFPDALAGAAAAGRFERPLLLLDSGIPPSTSGELSRLEPFLITILGGTGAVSGATETALGAYADTVERVSSTNRYLTAVEISKKAFLSDGSADVVYVATGLGFADALAAGPAAATLNGPVLLVDGTNLLQAVADEIVRLTPDRIIVVGGTSVISDGVLTALDALQGGDTVERISGPNRYATAVAISEDAFPDGAPRVYIATGLNFPDALAGAAAAGMHESPVLLVPGTSIPAVVSAEIVRLGANTIYILGGTAVVSSGVENDLKTLIGAS